MNHPTTTALLVLSLSIPLAAQAPHEGESCSASSVGSFDCLTVPVYEDREKEAGRELELHVVVLPATGDEYAPDPVFFLPGGPGQGATTIAAHVAGFLAEVHRERDIVLVDYRGTGESHPLDFELSNDDILKCLSNPLPHEIVERELERLRQNADLTQYHTNAIVDDLNYVREFLGYEQINLWGGSYGTRVALVFLRRHPEIIRSAVIKGVAPMGFAIGAEFSTDAQKSLDRTLAACAADPDCSSAYGDVGAKLGQLFARLEEEPVVVPVKSPLDGSTIEVPMTSDVIALALRDSLYSSPMHAALPGMIARGAEGQLEEWARMAVTSTVMMTGQLCEGLFLSVAKAEDAPLLERVDFGERARGTFLDARFVHGLLTAFETWPGATVDPAFWEPVRSDVPVLVVSGVLDPVTPANQGEEAARHLSNALHLVFDQGSHDDTAFRPCMDQVYADFYRSGTIEGLDTSCASEVRPIQFE